MLGRSLAASLAEVAVGARFLRRLPGFLRRPVTTQEAHATLRRRLERREADFLALARRAVYANPRSPYRALLGLAGCELGDLQRLARDEGVEGTLHVLLRHGVYLTLDEFKGRRPVVRGSATLTVDPRRLRNPAAAAHLVAQSGGSRGAGTIVPLDLAFLRDHAVNWRLVLEARRCAAGTNALWLVPGAHALINLLESASYGAPMARWFTPVAPAAPGLHPRYRWSARALRLASVLARVPLPPPSYVPPEGALSIAGWAAGARRTGRPLHVTAPASAAVAICWAALEAGLDLGGAQFTVGSEPLTAARLAVIRRAGAEAATSYRSTESGRIGYGCLARRAPDDLHVHHDLVALIQPGPDGPAGGLPPAALLVSSLRPRAPLILLNVSLGDQAELTHQSCGCPLERLGWATHLHTIRSYEKLTAGGMTFPDTDVVRALEEVLPARFGGGPTDYQLVEDEDEDGRPRLRLLVHPAVGPLDEAAVADAFLAALGAGSGAERIMTLEWRGANRLRVDRRPPLATASGKILHLHQAPSVAARARP